MNTTNKEIGKITKEEINKEIKSLTKDKPSEGNTIFHTTKKWLNENYDVRLNIVSQKFECKTKNEKEFGDLNDNDLYVKANENNINISHNKLLAILRSDFIPRYNPISYYFDHLPEWDHKTDHISLLIDHLELAQGQNQTDFFIQFKKWLVRTVKCALIDGYFNKQAFILSDEGLGQNIGKSSFIRNLCPKSLNQYYTENLTGNDKDDAIQMTKNILINLDELAGLYRKELTKLKASMSTPGINVRLPYARTSTTATRIASFIGSTNETSFLFDQTGSVRWVCFVIKSIDFKYSNDIDIDLVWAQAFALHKQKEYIAEMTPEEIRENELRNQRFYAMSAEEELILNHFAVPLNTSDPLTIYLSATEVLSRLRNKEPLVTLRASSVTMGKYLTKLGFQSMKKGGLKKYSLKEL